MLTTDMRLKVIGAIQSHRLSLEQLIGILKIYYIRKDFTEEELSTITDAYNKVYNGEINAANYMDFFILLKGVKRTERNDVESGVTALVMHRDELNKLK